MLGFQAFFPFFLATLTWALGLLTTLNVHIMGLIMYIPFHYVLLRWTKRASWYFVLPVLIPALAIFFVLVDLQSDLLKTAFLIIMGFFLLYLYLVKFIFSKWPQTKEIPLAASLTLTLPYFLPLRILEYTDFGSFAFSLGPSAPYLYPFTWIGGSFGLTAGVLFVNAYTAHTIWRPCGRKIALSLVAFVFFSLCFLTAPLNILPTDGSVTVTAIQGVEPETSKNELWLDEYKELSSKHLDSDIIIWPENAIPTTYWKGNTTKVLRELSLRGPTILSGSINHQNSKVYNTIIQYKKGKFVDSYDARIPFPYFNKREPGTSDDNVFAVNDIVNLGAITCFEETQPEVIRKTVDKDMGLLIAFSSNYHFDNFENLLQYHARYSAVRASENARYLVRATKTGITQIINPQGIILETLPIKEKTTGTFVVPIVRFVTPYSRWGRIPFWLLWLVGAWYVTKCIKAKTSTQSAKPKKYTAIEKMKNTARKKSVKKRKKATSKNLQKKSTKKKKL